MSLKIQERALGHLFFVDDFSNVIARDGVGGEIKSQSVEALLLLAILQKLSEGKSEGQK